ALSPHGERGGRIVQGRLITAGNLLIAGSEIKIPASLSAGAKTGSKDPSALILGRTAGSFGSLSGSSWTRLGFQDSGWAKEVRGIRIFGAH
ncbi:hypothetical protein, partial [Zoogloea sp.]|uniref:hypothetical protein n=1 Tax=Zoogloea sp. TaxID=49181 RepID=UPI00260FDD19